MKNMAKRMIEEEYIKSITCDCCGKVYNDIFEMQEFLSWDNLGGYGNFTYGDMTEYSLDLCQYCVKEVLGKFIKSQEIDSYV